MTFLIDSNVVIAAEPFNGKLEARHAPVSKFLRIAGEHGHVVFVHPATRDDLGETRDPAHRAQNLAAFEKYPALTDEPASPAVLAEFPSPIGKNDDRDARILAALHVGAVHFLVTDDTRLRKRAGRLGLELKVLTPGEAATQLAAWHPDVPPPPPSVEEMKTYLLDTSQGIFDDLRRDYSPHFDAWVAKVKTESITRRAWVVRTPSGEYEAMAIVKMRDAHPSVPGAEAIKLSTFKVADSAAGRRLGELMLKAVLRWAASEPGRPSELFVEVDAAKVRMVEFLRDFGFAFVTLKPGKPDEHVYLKSLDPQAGQALGGLEHHVAYGPPAIRTDQPVFIIPITPQWYEDLFPDATVIGASGVAVIPGTVASTKAHGNAIRKAYLCHSPTKSIPAGSTLLFYRSQGKKRGDGAIVAVGVAEMSSRSADPVETIELSFKRTVYSADDVAGLHQDGKAVLTILFRHDRFLVPPWTLDDIVSNSLVRSWPQSIVRVADGKAIAWVEQMLNASP
ncbi:hypothetical protein [Microbacterium sp. NPDC089696]|uniref:hypothetical protein n=1 Tax=Microbacterium sp. NPDC089696 TaxID=3364199 RepID=UPI003818AD3A